MRKNSKAVSVFALILLASVAYTQATETAVFAPPETTDTRADSIAEDETPLFAEAEFDDIVEPDGITIDPRERPMEPMAPEGLEIGKAGEYSYFSSDAVGIGTGAVEPGVQLEIYSPTGTGVVDMLRLRSKHDTATNVYSLYFSPREVSYVIENGATGTNLTLSTKAVSGGSFQAGYGNILLMPHGNVGVGETSPGAKLDVNGDILLQYGVNADAIRDEDDMASNDADALATQQSIKAYVDAQVGSITGDNLGNHTATENLKMSGSWVSNDGGDEGIFVATDGDVGIGTNSPDMQLDVNGSAQIQDVLRGGNWRHVLSDGFNSTASNGYLLTTSIPYDGATQRGMHSVRIIGYAYGNQDPIDFVVNFYLYTSGLSSYGWTNYGAYDPGTVKLSYEGGYVKIWWSTTVYYPSYEVFTTSWIGSVDTDAHFEGWDITDAAPPSTNVVDVPYKNAEPQGLTMGGNIALTGNFLSGDGGSEGVYVDNSGNVGVGETSPGAKLDVNGDILLQYGVNADAIRDEDNMASNDADALATQQSIKAYVDAQVGATTDDQTLNEVYNEGGNVVTLDATGDIQFQNDETTPVQMLFLDESSGNVGIGTASPGSKLNVNGIVSTNNNIYFGSNTAGGSDEIATEFNDGIIVYTPVSGDRLVSIEVDNDDILTATQSGNVGIGTTSPAAKLDVEGGIASYQSGGSFIYLNPGASGSAVNYSGSLDINEVSGYPGGLGTSNRVLIDASGNVGIGSSAPAYKLDVDGTARVTGFRMETGASNGYILQSDADGDASWVAPPSVPSDNVTGSGTQNYVAKFTSTGSIIGNSSIYDNGNVGIGTTSPAQKLHVNGDINISSGSGIRINNTATSGQYLRGNGTRFVSSAIQASDIPTGSGNYIQNLGRAASPQSNAGWRVSMNPVASRTDTTTWINITPSSWPTDGVITANIVNIATLDDGHASAYRGLLDVDGPTYIGNVRFDGAYADSWDAQGRAVGVRGSATASKLASRYGSSVEVTGLNGKATGDDLTPDGSPISSGDDAQRLIISGVTAELGGTINNAIGSPDTFRVAALWAVDNRTGGTATSYAGYFDGDVHITGNLTGGGLSSSNWTLSGTDLYPSSTTYDVGIGTASPSEKLHVVGDVLIKNTGSRKLTMEAQTAGDVILDLKPNVTGSQLTYINSTYGFQFKTNTSGTAVDALRITNTGKVGIGTTSPTSQLHSVSTLYGPIAPVNRAAVAGVNENAETSYRNGIGVYGSCASSNTNGHAGYFEGRGYFSGNVGIGTSSPPAKLSVEGNAYFADDIYLRDGSTTSGDMLVRIYDSSDDGVIDVYQNNSVVNRIHGNGSSYFTGGNVGVGTTSPDARLHSESSYCGPVDPENRASIAGINTSTNSSEDYDNAIGVYGYCNGLYGQAGYMEGDLRVTGKYLDSSGDPGSSGQILSSTGSGTNWIAAPSGGSLPSGSSGQTLRHNGTSWIANSTLYNNGTNVGIGTSSPTYKLHVSDVPSTSGTKYNFRSHLDNQYAGSATDYNAYFYLRNNTSQLNNSNQYNIYNYTYNYGDGASYGMYLTSSKYNDSGDNYGIRSYCNNGATSYALYGYANGASTNYAGYFNAVGGSTNYAGYFAGGNVYVQNSVGIGTSPDYGKLQIQHEGDATANEWGTHALMIRDRDHALYMGADTDTRCAYIRSTDIGTAQSNLALNPDGGNVGIGTTSPTYKLHVLSSGTANTAYFSNGYGSGASIGLLAYGLYVNGTLGISTVNATSSGNNMRFYNNRVYYYSSSRKYKDDIREFDDDPYMILKAEPKDFTDKVSKERNVGFIAEEFDSLGLYPLVIYNDAGEPDALEYQLIPIYMLGVMKDQQTRIDNLEKQTGTNTVNISDFGREEMNTSEQWVYFSNSFSDQLKEDDIPVVTVTPNCPSVVLCITETTREGFRVMGTSGKADGFSFNWIAMASIQGHGSESETSQIDDYKYETRDEYLRRTKKGPYAVETEDDLDIESEENSDIR